jgi:hypothetical protein
MEYTDGRPSEPVLIAGTEQGAAEFKPGSVFLSYPSEDRATALLIKEALETAGIDVWLDTQDLETGDHYRRKIMKNIEQCSFFVPLISRHVLTNERRFFRVEWNFALEECNMRPPGVPFLLPVVIDETPLESAFIPSKFKEVHWENLPNGTVDDNFVSVCRKRIRDLRREEARA